MHVSKELSMENRTYMTQLKTKKANFFVFLQFYLNFAVFLQNFINNIHFTEFHSLLVLTDNFEEKSYVLPLYT